MNVSKILTAALAVLWLSGQAVFGQWATSGNTIYNTNTGNVGIGTTSPEGTLHVHIASAGTVTANGSANDLVVENSGNAGINILTPSAKTGRLMFGTPISNFQSALVWDNTNSIFDITTSKAGGILTFSTNVGSERMRIDNTGKVGIGTTGPATKLEVENGAITVDNTGTIQIGTDSGRALEIKGSSANAYIDLADTEAEDADVRLQSDSDEDLNIFTGGALGTPKVTVSSAGNMGIGTTSPTHKLTVNGYIGAEEVAIVPDIPADFVFEDDYALRSLEEVEQYIDAHGHLPEIPSGEEMQADGVGLAAMQMKLLQKIEELTLYLIAQNKVLTAMQEESALVKERLIALEAAGN